MILLGTTRPAMIGMQNGRYAALPSMLSIAAFAAAAAASISAVRVYSLVITPRWWESKDEGVGHAFAEKPPRPSFELPEEGREEGGESAGR